MEIRSEEDLKKIIEQKVEKKVEQETEKLKNQNKELRKEIQKLKQKKEKPEKTSKKDKRQEKDISRRSFLKKLGAGAAGLGAISLLPSVSAFDVKSTDGLEVYDSNKKYFDVNPGGPVEVTNTNLRLPTGQNIEDENGARRLSIESTATSLRDENGDASFQALGGVENTIWARSGQPLRIRDGEGGFRAIEYTTSASTPGTLELTSADLDASTNAIEVDGSTGSRLTHEIGITGGPGIAMYVVTLDSGTSENLSSNYHDATYEMHGIMMINETGDTNGAAIFMLNGGGAGTNVSLVQDMNGQWGTSAGENEHNLYFDGTDYILENTEGYQNDYRVQYFGRVST